MSCTESNNNRLTPAGSLTIDAIIELTARRFRVSANDIVSRCRTQKVCNARAAVVFLGKRLILCKRLSESHLPEIVRIRIIEDYVNRIRLDLAEALNRDHTSIESLDRRALELRKTSIGFCALTNNLWSELCATYGIDSTSKDLMLAERTISEMTTE